VIGEARNVRRPVLGSAIQRPAQSNVQWSIYVCVALIALAVALAMVFVGFRSQSLVDTRFDPYDFGAMGKSIAAGDGFTPFGSLLERRAPLYPAMIGATYFLLGEQPTVIYLLQAVLVAATCVIVLDIGRRLFNTRTGIIAALLCALNPMLLRYVGDLQLETLLTFLFTATVWVAVRFYARPTVTLGVAVGAFAGLASLTKSVAFPYPFLFAAGIVAIAIFRRWRGSESSIPWRGLAAMFATLALLIAPWTARNYVATSGHIVLISSGTSDAFLRGYIFSKPDYALLRLSPYEYAENESNDLFRTLSNDAGTEWMRDDYETDQILNRASAQKLISEPGEFVRKFATGLFTFWYQMTSLTNSVVAGGLAVATWALACVGLRRARREGQTTWPLLLPAVYLNLILAALLALGRYSVPVLPALLVISAFGIDALLGQWKPGRVLARAN
jgi:4-amino-4-deoxy-L-arabinose transferase-like glycosyltransferase